MMFNMWNMLQHYNAQLQSITRFLDSKHSKLVWLPYTKHQANACTYHSHSSDITFLPLILTFSTFRSSFVNVLSIVQKNTYCCTTLHAQLQTMLQGRQIPCTYYFENSTILTLVRLPLTNHIEQYMNIHSFILHLTQIPFHNLALSGCHL